MDTENTNQMPIEAEVIKPSGELKFKELWLESWGILKAKWRSLFPWFCIWIVAQLLNEIPAVGFIFGGLLSLYAMIGLVYVVKRREEVVSFRDIRQDVNAKFGQFFITTVGVTILTLGLTGLFIVPGIIGSLLFSQYMFIGVYQNIFGREAVWESRRLMLGRLRKYLYLVIVPVILALIFVAVIVGIPTGISILLAPNSDYLFGFVLLGTALLVAVMAIWEILFYIYSALIYERLVATYVPKTKVRPLEKAKKMIYWGAGVGYMIIIVFGAGMLYLAITNPELFDVAEPSTLDFEELQGDYMNVPVDQAFKL